MSESGEDDTYATDKVDLGSGYLQCRAAREAANVDLVTDISCNENATKSEQKTGDKVGSMDIAIDRDIKGCFKGSRIEKNGVLVCAADFSLLNLPKGKSLGRSKPATNS